MSAKWSTEHRESSKVFQSSQEFRSATFQSKNSGTDSSVPWNNAGTMASRDVTTLWAPRVSRNTSPLASTDPINFDELRLHYIPDNGVHGSVDAYSCDFGRCGRVYLEKDAKSSGSRQSRARLRLNWNGKTCRFGKEPPSDVNYGHQLGPPWSDWWEFFTTDFCVGTYLGYP